MLRPAAPLPEPPARAILLRVAKTVRQQSVQRPAPLPLLSVRQRQDPQAAMTVRFAVPPAAATQNAIQLETSLPAAIVQAAIVLPAIPRLPQAPLLSALQASDRELA